MRDEAPRHEQASEVDRHGRRVHDHLSSAIVTAGGWLSFERYMDLALYAPGLGYYSAGASKLGDGGDFTTAPEISSLFGACVARQCAQVLEELAAGSLLEIGAGSGRLAVDILTRLESLGRLPEHYFILEISADLRARQVELIERCVPQLRARVSWLDTPPAAFDGVIVANEVLDALPVTRFRYRRDGCEELGVICSGGGFAWSARPAGARLAAACRVLSTAAGGWDEGYVSEYCPRLGAWTHAVTRALRRGAVLWFDYGLPRPQYYLAERHEGTLLCHHRQRAHDDPFAFPGLQDITAWVDFTALAEACLAAGCELQGFATQAFFLAATGIDREMQLMARDDAHFAQLAQQAKRLMMPGEMGERFKAMAWSRGLAGELAGFALQDLRHSL